MNQRVIISENIEKELEKALAECEHDKVFILTDTTTRKLCLQKIVTFPCLSDANVIMIEPSDTHKDLHSLAHVWTVLGSGGATRHSCLINLGGGMVTDLGGFAASTFKRGINFINIPTTLLAMTDASVGGKTGINFLDSLDTQNIRSGYGEMLKHALISNEEMWAEAVNFNLDTPDLAVLQKMVADSVAVKERIVLADPLEHGIRKALNLGHTVGHAFESWAMQQGTPILHGYAVAYGLVAELYLSAVKTGFPTEQLRQTVAFIHENYGTLGITCDDYEALYSLMTHDKKNIAGRINFTLLGGIGDIRINQTATKNEIFEALDFFRDGI